MPLNTETLRKLLHEYGGSLTRMDAERDLQKTMALRAEAECGVPAPIFRKTALAYHRDRMTAMREAVQVQMDLLEALASGPQTGEPA